MRVAVATICCKDIESKLVGESTLSQGSLSFPIVLIMLKKTLSALLKLWKGQETLGTRLARDYIIEESRLIFLEYSKKIFKATWLDIFRIRGVTKGSRSANYLPF